MNSVAAVITTDFYKRLKSSPSEKTALSVARWSTFFIGAIGTVFALMMAQWDIKSLWDQASAIIGLFGGGLGGLFLLGIFTRRTGATAALLALIVSGLVQYYLKVNTSIHIWLYAFSGIVSCFVTGVILSLIIPNRKKDMKSLTIHNLRQGQ